MLLRPFLLAIALLLASCDVAAPPAAPPPVSSLAAAPGPLSGGFRGNTLEPLQTSAGANAAPVSRRAPSDAPPSGDAAAFARAFLNGIQPQSVAQRRELCGYFFLDDGGRIAATPPRTGSFAGCEMPVPRQGQRIFASYHTHSAYAPGYDNEVPSVQDLLSDFEFGLDGYVSTPGGRVWRVDYATRSTYQVCGRGCVYMDPQFRPDAEASIQQRYDVPGLGRRATMF